MYACPKCNSENVQTFKMACITGTTTNAGYYTGITTDLEDGYLGVLETTSKSALAKALAPPKKRTVPALITIICFLCFPLLFVLRSYEKEAQQWNDEEYPKLYAEWESSWICYKCGTTFVQQ